MAGQLAQLWISFHLDLWNHFSGNWQHKRLSIKVTVTLSMNHDVNGITQACQGSGYLRTIEGTDVYADLKHFSNLGLSAE